MIYLDHAATAATTPVHPDVAKVLYDVLNNCFGNSSSIYAIGREAKEINGAIRMSLGRSNAEEGIPSVIEKLSGLVHKLSQFSPACESK
ncbi:MAG TPA: hypothetical protein DDY25_09280 [Peptococcaceae bacterium]|jgi:cysteine sulfinate desulfinase/cysteine desulfurase-like protein|nr:hypothetical protein [Peptococcaceae bacterium]